VCGGVFVVFSQVSNLVGGKEGTIEELVTDQHKKEANADTGSSGRLSLYRVVLVPPRTMCERST
jgi:hypothetical protein